MSEKRNGKRNGESKAFKRILDIILLKNIAKESRRSIASIFFFTISLLLLLAGFGKAGVVGSDLYEILDYLLGIGYFILPLLSFVISISLFKNKKEDEKSGHRVTGSVLFFLSSLTLLAIFEKETSGVIGLTFANFLLSLFDLYGSVIISIALLIISLLVLFEFALISPLLILKNIFLKFISALKGAFGKKEKVNDSIETLVENAVKSVPIPQKTPEPKETENFDEEESEEEFKTKNGYAGENYQNDSKIRISIFPFRNEKYIPPPLSLLETDRGKPGVGDIKANANIIKRTLQNFGIAVEMDEISIGSSVTRYAIKPAEGVRLQKILALQQNLELALAAHPVRIEAPIPGKSLVGIEVPNSTKSIVGLGSLLGSEEFQNSEKPLLVGLGRGITGKSHFGNIAKMPHLLIAGATGSGKSVMIHSIITSLLYRNSPENLRLIMIDPKRVELTLYNGIPHLLNPVITDPKKAISSLRWAAKEMERRYEILEAEKVRDIDSYHKNILAPALEKLKRKGSSGKDGADEKAPLPEMMPYICIFIDELADIMATFPRELEAAVIRLAQMSRAVGIHLILSTQRPSVNVITGLIKANVPARLALQVASQMDSRTILDMGGAEKLLGAGDMLYLSAEMAQPSRLQSPFITESELKKVTKHIIKEGEKFPPNEIDLSSNNGDGSGGIFASIIEYDNSDIDDDLYEEARDTIIKAGKASTSYLQRKLRIGYARAARLMDLLEEKGVIGAGEGAKPREVLIKNEGMGTTEDTEESEFKN
ncbi:MAG: DNA translocase FtsK 4TM domain-containing protein [Patescibacteria group bacterium]